MLFGERRERERERMLDTISLHLIPLSIRTPHRTASVAVSCVAAVRDFPENPTAAVSAAGRFSLAGSVPQTPRPSVVYCRWRPAQARTGKGRLFKTA